MSTLETLQPINLIELLKKEIIMKTWQCVVCGFTYDETKGDPEHGLEPGTSWENVPADWSCPDCGVAKADFEMVEV
jgi:rubredoxin